MWVFLLDDVGRQVPQRVEGGVGQPDAAVGAEHGDAFGQIVERLALHAHRGVVAAFEVHLLGQVLEDPGDAALGLRIGDDADRAAVGQVPPVLLRVDGAVGAKQRFLPAAPFRLLGDLALAAQPVDQQRIVGRAVQEARCRNPRASGRPGCRSAASRCCRRWPPPWSAGPACRHGCAPCAHIPRASPRSRSCRGRGRPSLRRPRSRSPQRPGDRRRRPSTGSAGRPAAPDAARVSRRAPGCRGTPGRRGSPSPASGASTAAA